MDPLSDVLSLLKLRSFGCRGVEIGGDWCLQFPSHSGIKYYAVGRGQGWLSVDGVPDPIQFQAGDCFLLPRGRSFRMGTSLNLPPIDFMSIPMATNGTITSFNGGGDHFMVGGHFALSSNHASILLNALPPIVHLQKQSDKAALRWAMHRIMEELRDPQPGGHLIAEHLAHMILVQALRLHLSKGLNGGVGWLFALADKQMSAAINAIHEAPGHRWTLHELAKRVGMSRSAFAQKFKQTVGKSPMDYLASWRMLLATDKLSNSTDPISTIALTLGYESEAAFSTAFKRVMGCSPRQYTPTPKLGTGRGRIKIIDPQWADPMMDEEVDALINGRY